ncbi:MAG: DUF4150 domain-containing protein [Burkholderiaceae bacterium]
MPVSVKVNGVANSLVHKGSNGVSIATMPDVCKTPSPGGPVPIPYPNISQSMTLAKGTTTVKADRGMMIANKGSEFSMSNGDNAGVAGGVKSSTFMKESTWILYSFDVKLDGKNACRLSDKKFQNHENTVDLAGTGGPPRAVPPIASDDCGGAYSTVRASREGGEVHHSPANSVSPLSRNRGPAIWMTKRDHRRTASCGSSRAARRYRAKQKSLIKQGKFREAMARDIRDIRKKFGKKYDKCIRLMLAYFRSIPKSELKS